MNREVRFAVISGFSVNSTRTGVLYGHRIYSSAPGNFNCISSIIYPQNAFRPSFQVKGFQLESCLLVVPVQPFLLALHSTTGQLLICCCCCCCWCRFIAHNRSGNSFTGDNKILAQIYQFAKNDKGYYDQTAFSQFTNQASAFMGIECLWNQVKC
jgi:hypothetical protein